MRVEALLPKKMPPGGMRVGRGHIIGFCHSHCELLFTMATPSSLSPSPVYRNKQGKKLEELYPKLKEKCPGIRVFYFNATGQHCDHGRQHNESWKTRLQDGKSLEAGTVVALITPRTHARARGYVIGRGVYIYI